MKPEAAVNKLINDAANGAWAVGIVTAISGSLLTVTVRGTSLTLPKLASYSATLNDVVQIAWPPNRPFVLGKIG